MKHRTSAFTADSIRVTHFPLRAGWLAPVVFAKRAAAVAGLCAALATSSPAQTFTTLLNFGGRDGDRPEARLMQASDGDFYGTTVAGGAYGDGTVFKITPGGALTVLYSFCAQSGCTDGQAPYASLVQTTNGDFYGTTYYGGNSCSQSTSGCGTVFKIDARGALTTLHSFCTQSGCTDGALPYAGLMQATNGDLYGTTDSGGAYGLGTVFRITPGGALTVLYSFCAESGCADGSFPYTGLVQAANGDFYGTTVYGGANGLGTVFRITPGGALTVLYSFCAESGCADGSFPYIGLVQAANGDFYGVTSSGGAHQCGTVFEITPSGTLTTIYNEFAAGNGAPSGGLVQATDGNFYGTALGQGTYSAGGTLFKITPSGTLTTLHTFRTPQAPFAGLLQATNGDFYGITDPRFGGDDGSIFSLSVGLGAFVEPQTTSGRVGSTVKILGNDLTGATSVSFNGTPASFTVDSSGTSISATVPIGATTGTVQVITPGGALSSNVPFRVP